jgi:hypothetical protein
MNKLVQVLGRLFKHDEFTGYFASVMARATERGSISYHEVEEIAGDRAEDVLLLSSEWRFLLPVRTLKSAAWEDRLLLCESGEKYEVPNIVRCMVKKVSQTGEWNLEQAATELFKEMDEPEWEKMPKLVERLKEQARDYRISAIQIKEICSELGLEDRVDVLIAELKGSGVMSPKLSSLAEVSREGAPLYEINPSLFIKEGEKK